MSGSLELSLLLIASTAFHFGFAYDKVFSDPNTARQFSSITLHNLAESDVFTDTQKQTMDEIYQILDLTIIQNSQNPRMAPILKILFRRSIGELVGAAEGRNAKIQADAVAKAMANAFTLTTGIIDERFINDVMTVIEIFTSEDSSLDDESKGGTGDDAGNSFGVNVGSNSYNSRGGGADDTWNYGIMNGGAERKAAGNLGDEVDGAADDKFGRGTSKDIGDSFGSHLISPGSSSGREDGADSAWRNDETGSFPLKTSYGVDSDNFGVGVESDVGGSKTAGKSAYSIDNDSGFVFTHDKKADGGGFNGRAGSGLGMEADGLDDGTNKVINIGTGEGPDEGDDGRADGAGKRVGGDLGGRLGNLWNYDETKRVGFGKNLDKDVGDGTNNDAVENSGNDHKAETVDKWNYGEVKDSKLATNFIEGPNDNIGGGDGDDIGGRTGIDLSSGIFDGFKSRFGGSWSFDEIKDYELGTDLSDESKSSFHGSISHTDHAGSLASSFAESLVSILVSSNQFISVFDNSVSEDFIKANAAVIGQYTAEALNLDDSASSALINNILSEVSVVPLGSNPLLYARAIAFASEHFLDSYSNERNNDKRSGEVGDSFSYGDNNDFGFGTSFPGRTGGETDKGISYGASDKATGSGVGGGAVSGIGRGVGRGIGRGTRGDSSSGASGHFNGGVSDSLDDNVDEAAGDGTGAASTNGLAGAETNRRTDSGTSKYVGNNAIRGTGDSWSYDETKGLGFGNDFNNEVVSGSGGKIGDIGRKIGNSCICDKAKDFGDGAGSGFNNGGFGRNSLSRGSGGARNFRLSSDPANTMNENIALTLPTYISSGSFSNRELENYLNLMLSKVKNEILETSLKNIVIECLAKFITALLSNIRGGQSGYDDIAPILSSFISQNLHF